jgi:hypothetical protein
MKADEFEISINDTLTRINDSCKEFISGVKAANTFLYRGIDTRKPFFNAATPNTRMPLGQSLQEQAMLDHILKTNGFTALRSNSRSCTPNITEVYLFGNPYLIFPEDGFSFTWSQHVSDIGISRLVQKELHNWIAPRNPFSKRGNIPTHEEALTFIKNLGFRHDNLPEALASGNEIIIHGNYFALSRYYIQDASNYFNIEEGS